MAVCAWVTSSLEALLLRLERNQALRQGREGARRGLGCVLLLHVLYSLKFMCCFFKVVCVVHALYARAAGAAVKGSRALGKDGFSREQLVITLCKQAQPLLCFLLICTFFLQHGATPCLRRVLKEGSDRLPARALTR